MADTFTAEEIEKFADFIIKQFDREMERRFPISPDIAAMTDDELLIELNA